MISHKEKVALARRGLTREERKRGGVLKNYGIFLSKAWEKRRDNRRLKAKKTTQHA